MGGWVGHCVGRSETDGVSQRECHNAVQCAAYASLSDVLLFSLLLLCVADRVPVPLCRVVCCAVPPPPTHKHCLSTHRSWVTWSLSCVAL